MKFSLKAVPMYAPPGAKPKYAIKEFFSFVSSQQEMKPYGGPARPVFVSDGIVDDDIRAQNKTQYDIFKAYYDKNQDQLNAMALATPETHIMVEDLMKAEKASQAPKITSSPKVKKNEDK